LKAFLNNTFKNGGFNLGLCLFLTLDSVQEVFKEMSHSTYNVTVVYNKWCITTVVYNNGV